MAQTEKQKCINEYFNNIKQMSLAFRCDIHQLNKREKRFLRFKFACVNGHPKCDRIFDNKTTLDFEACQVKCRYSYEYAGVAQLAEQLPCNQ